MAPLPNVLGLESDFQILSEVFLFIEVFFLFDDEITQHG